MSKSRFSLMLFVVLSSFVLTVTSTYAITTAESTCNSNTILTGEVQFDGGSIKIDCRRGKGQTLKGLPDSGRIEAIITVRKRNSNRFSQCDGGTSETNTKAVISCSGRGKGWGQVKIHRR